MAKPGPAPKPTALKKLQGNPGKRPLNNHEPQPDADRAICPAWLPPKAKAEWRYIAPLLYDCGLLTKVDRMALVEYCEAVASYREAVEHLQREEVRPVYQNHQGNWMKNPYVSIKNVAWEQVMKSAAKFGMTPSDRTGLVVEEEKPRTLADVLFEAAQSK